MEHTTQAQTGKTGAVVARNDGPWGKSNGEDGANKEARIDEILRKRARNLGSRFNNKGRFPAGSYEPNKLILLVIIGAIILWMLSGLHPVGPGQRGLIMTLGQYSRIEYPGLRYRLPSPITHLTIVDADVQQKTEIGFRQRGARASNTSPNSKESLMLTGDRNIVDITFTVDWKIDTSVPDQPDSWPNEAKYAFNIENPPQLVKSVAEASIREVVGAMNLQDIITGARTQVQARTKDLIQKAMDDYDSGIAIIRVNLQEAAPPPEVVDAFRDVIDAGSDAEVTINTATRYANQKVPQAQGQAEEIRKSAEAYRSRVVAAARGEAERFDAIRRAYEASPIVTRERLYLEAMRKVYENANVTILEEELSGTVLPFLPLVTQQPPSREER